MTDKRVVTQYGKRKKNSFTRNKKINTILRRKKVGNFQYLAFWIHGRYLISNCDFCVIMCNVEELRINYPVPFKMRIKRKGCKTAVRPAMKYRAAIWAATKVQDRKLDVAETRMLRWMYGFTKLDRIRNDIIRQTPWRWENLLKVQCMKVG